MRRGKYLGSTKGRYNFISNSINMGDDRDAMLEKLGFRSKAVLWSKTMDKDKLHL